MAVFSILRGVVFSELPCPDPDRVAELFSVGARKPSERLPISGLNFREIASEMKSIEAADAIFPVDEMQATIAGRIENVAAAYVSSDLLTVLGIAPISGAGFTRDGAFPNAAWVSEPFWRSRLNRSPEAIGSTIEIPPHRSATIVGILPSSPILRLVFHTEPALFFQANSHPAWSSRSAYGFRGLVRLSPGVSIEKARKELEAIAARLHAAFPGEDKDFDPNYFPLAA